MAQDLRSGLMARCYHSCVAHEPPLDFLETLDVLSTWRGSTVLVTAHGQARGERPSPTQTVLRGELGSVEMVESAFPGVEITAGYAVGGAPNGLYLSAGDFIKAQRLGPSHLALRFRHQFRVEVHRLL